MAEEKTAAEEVAAEAAAAAAAKRGKDRSDVDKPTEVVLARRAFINGRLYEAGETVEALPVVGFGVAQSTRVGDLSVEQLEQFLAAKRAKEGLPETAKSQFDHDKDGADGGSLSKAKIAARLTELQVDFDATKSRDELAVVLADAEKAAQKK